MTARHRIAAVVIAAALTLTATPAAAESCTIPSGTYRRVAIFGCGAVGYISGRWIGNVQSTSGANVNLERRWSNLWLLVATDRPGGGHTAFDVAAADATSVRIRQVSPSLTLALPVYRP